MILTVTLNTSIDKVYVVENFSIGDVIRVKEATYTPGGKGLNVAKVLSALGEEVLAAGFAGGFAGGFIESELRKLGIPYKFIRVHEETRSCINIIDEKSRIQTELLEPGPWVSPDELSQFVELFETLLRNSDVVTLSGSLPRGLDDDTYRVLISIAKGKGKKVILDSSGIAFKEGLSVFPTMIKPNIREAEAVLGRRIESISEAAAAAKELTALGAGMAAISMGAEGVVVADSGTGSVYHAKPPLISPVNTVGCGDAMVAGFAVALRRGYDLETTIKIGTAVSAAAALTPETGGCRPDDVNRFINDIKIELI
jgi:tagatose 6-phosphate kinase